MLNCLKGYFFGQVVPEVPRPTDVGLTIIIVGDAQHEHQYEEVPWNHKRDGRSMIDFDKDPGGPIAFPQATYRTLLRCSCGREGISSVRSLI